MNNQLNNGFLIFSGINENETYGKMFSQIINDENFFLMRLKNIFTE